MPLVALRRRLQFWTSKHLLLEAPVPAAVSCADAFEAAIAAMPAAAAAAKAKASSKHVEPRASSPTVDAHRSAVLEALRAIPASRHADVLYTAANLSALSASQRAALVALARATQKCAAQTDVFGAILAHSSSSASHGAGGGGGGTNSEPAFESVHDMLEHERLHMPAALDGESAGAGAAADDMSAGGASLHDAAAWSVAAVGAELERCILGILGGLDSLPLDRIVGFVAALLGKELQAATSSLAAATAAAPSYPRCLEAHRASRAPPSAAFVKSVLDAAVAQGKCAVSGGMYRAVKAPRF